MSLAVTLAAASFAQDLSSIPAGPEAGFDAHGFRWVSSASDLRAPMRVYRPSSQAGPSWSVGALADWASRPVIFEDPEGNRTFTLSDVAAVNLAAGFAPVAPLRIDVSAPVFLTSTSTYPVSASGGGGGASVPAGGSSGPAAGDVRVSALATVKRPDPGSGFGVGLIGAVDLPTGDPDRWLGTRGLAGVAGVSGTYERESLTASWQVAARFAPESSPEEWPTPTRGGDTVEVGGGLGWLAGERLGVGLEAHASVPMTETLEAAIGVPAEALLSGRYRGARGAFLTAGLGVGLGSGAGASPIRLLVGGGFGTGGSAAPEAAGGGRSGGPDADGDGVAGRADRCADQPETANGYLDEDGCPDTLPSLSFTAKLDGADQPEAVLVATAGDGTATEGKGTLTVSGLPGQKVNVAARVGACRRGSVETSFPKADTAAVSVPLTRLDGTVNVSVTDQAGRPLEGVQVRYVIADEVCRPADASVRAGRGSHTMGAGPVRAFVTALGYDVVQQEFELEPGQARTLSVKLKPTGVSLADGRLKVTQPIGFTESGALDAKAVSTLGQVVSVLLSTDGLTRVEIRAWAPAGGATKKLSLARAEAVKAELVAQGVAAELLVTSGQGALPRGQAESVQFLVTKGP